jgi:F0F1-type ATP synthase membrane subunit c/vacuolar-type H+-ATPase subunit K
VPSARAAKKPTTKIRNIMINTLAEAVGRNPGASTKILVQGIIGMALAEAVAFYALFLGK